MENMNLSFKIVKAKAKSIQSLPALSVTTSKNHFVFNNVAADALDVEAGDSVMLLYAGGSNDDARFLITKAVDTDESVAKVGSAGGTNFHFNYAGIYGSILLNDEERAMISIDELIDKGLMKEFDTAAGNKAIRGLTKVGYNLVSVGTFDVGGTEREVFALANRKVTNVTEDTVDNTGADADVESAEGYDESDNQIADM